MFGKILVFFECNRRENSQGNFEIIANDAGVRYSSAGEASMKSS